MEESFISSIVPDGGVSLFTPFWLFVVLVVIYFNVFRRYMRRIRIFRTDWILLEIILPREIMKTPRAMEPVFAALHHKRDSTWFDIWLFGRFVTWFSFEMVSIEGSIHFYVYCDRIQQRLVEAAIYAQYPEVIVEEVQEDYMKRIKLGQEKRTWDLYAMEYILKKSDAYPIRTYLDFELENQSNKEETKTDPISTIFEFMSSLGKEEYLVIQLLIKYNQKQTGSWLPWKKKKNWIKEGDAIVEKIMSAGGSIDSGGKQIRLGALARSPTENEIMKAIDRKSGKTAFDVGLRAMIVSPKSVFHKKKRIVLPRFYAPFDDLTFNSFKGNNSTKYPYPWQDYKKIRTDLKYKKTVRDFQLRSFFYAPHSHFFDWVAPENKRSKTIVLNTEELATIYHFPGSVVAAAGIGRIDSKKSEPPTNLPT